jgi:hypothetical protein
LEEFAGQTVGHYTDNRAVVFIFGGGSSNPKLQSLSLAIFLSLRKYKIILQPVWISRYSEIIQWADQGSRSFMSDNYSLDIQTFNLVVAEFGKLEFLAPTGSKFYLLQRAWSLRSQGALQALEGCFAPHIPQIEKFWIFFLGQTDKHAGFLYIDSIVMPLQIVLIVFVQQIFSRHSSPGSSGVKKILLKL